MALFNAICPNCNTVNAVDNTAPSCVCTGCKKSFFTEVGIAAWNNAYVVTLNREPDPKIRNDITFLTVYKGNVVPLANGGGVQILVSEREFEIPVLITDNCGITFEGVLTGTSDGKDVEITWAAKRATPLLGDIVSTSNPTVRFVERPGAAKNQTLRQES